MDNMKVYLGVWTNWSRGAVMGATLTTTREYGNLLIAFTAFFIPFVATRFWRICCFFLHRLHSTAEPKGAIHHQRQVLLRNASSMESALITLFSLIKSWRGKKQAKLATLLSLLGFTTLVVAAFTVAGGFSSRISSGMSDEVLINGNNCSIAGLDFGTSMESFEAVTQYLSKTYTDAANYAQQCYSDDSGGLLGCDKFVVKGLKTETIETNRSCPFPGDICRSNDTNIRLDTGFIDSHDHLGLNTPPDQRVGYRYVLECAPLKTDGHVTYTNQGNVTWAQYHYGLQSYGGSDNRTDLNFTHEVEDLSYQYPEDYIGPVRGDFLLNTVAYQVLYGEINSDRSSFTPIPELVRLDGDVTIIFLSGNGVYFYDPVDDDWYRATVKSKRITEHVSTGSHQAYHPVDAASPLACVEQWQWCNSNYQDGSGCGPLTSELDALFGASHLFNVSEDTWESGRPFSNTSTGSHFIWPALIGSIGDESVDWAVQQLKSSALASRTSSYSGMQYALPKNQWHLDVQRWWNTVLAKTQANLVNAAIGHADPSLKNNSVTPYNQYEQSLCYNQKVRSTDYASFSLFGLYFTYITGAIIVLVSLIVEPIFGCLQRRAKYKQYEHLEWTTNETLQLHRLAHEVLGSPQWSGCTDSVPTTLPEAKLVSLDIEDVAHPILSRPIKIEQEATEVTGDSLNVDLGPEFQLDVTGRKTAVHANETNEEHTEEIPPSITVGNHSSRGSLQASSSIAPSLSSDRVAGSEASTRPNEPQVSPTEHRHELSRHWGPAFESE